MSEPYPLAVEASLKGKNRPITDLPRAGQPMPDDQEVIWQAPVASCESKAVGIRKQVAGQVCLP